MSPIIPHFTDWQLEQYILNELDQDTTLLIDQNMNQDTELLERINAIKQSNAQVLIEMPAATFLKNNKLESKPNPKTIALSLMQRLKNKFNLQVATSAIAASFACLMVILILPNTQSDEEISLNNNDQSQLGIRLKGLKPSLKVYRKSGNELSNSEQLKKGDVLQLSYIAAGSDFGYIVSVDGRGVITEHLVNGKQSSFLNNDGEIALDFAYQLDDAPNFERFFMITSEQVFSSKLVKSAIDQLIQHEKSQLGELIIERDDQSFTVHSITLNKLESNALENK